MDKRTQAMSENRLRSAGAISVFVFRIFMRFTWQLRELKGSVFMVDILG